MLRHLSPVCLIVSLLVALTVSPPPALAQGPDDAELVFEQITPLQRSLTVIAIPTFDVTGEDGGLRAGTFRNIIYRDLEWFSDFKRAENQTFVDQTHRRDQRTGKIDYEEWQRLGCSFVLKGSFGVENGKIIAECRLFDVDYRKQVFGYRYKSFGIDEVRRQAHQISDTIVEKVFDQVGIASTQIVFVSRRGDSQFKEIYLTDADGENQRRMTRDNSLVAAPCWGKNGTEIYYTSYKDVNPDLCGIQLGTLKTWFISRRPVSNLSANWCAKTERIVLTLGKDGNPEIYSMARSGQRKTLRRLTYSPAMDFEPCWSPAGNQIVFTSDRTGYPQAWVMDADGTNPRLLTRQGRFNACPVWSPKGDKIAFAARDRLVFDIYTMNLDGGGWRQLTNGPDNCEDPSWAPDGRHLVFSSNRTGRYQIYIMRSEDGGNLHQLTFKGENTLPAWSPAPSK